VHGLLDWSRAPGHFNPPTLRGWTTPLFWVPNFSSNGEQRNAISDDCVAVSYQKGPVRVGAARKVLQPRLARPASRNQAQHLFINFLQ